ncbi:hypothetical protein PMAYCL1PPCAC_22154, partial [Pristionchus mayeri]
NSEKTNENNNDSPLVYMDGSLHDITAFAPRHPGGSKILHKVAGKEIGEYMRGEHIEGIRHAHSEAAYKILRKYAVSNSHEVDPLLASGRGILCQIGSLGDKYWPWIHQPYDGKMRIFDSDILETFTNTKWWMIPILWLPVAALFSIISLSHLSEDLGMVSGVIRWAICFTLGLLVWTMTEYIMHRFLFHFVPSPGSTIQIAFHFLLHGIHHKTPMDNDRLVLPPALGVSFFYIFYSIYTRILPWPIVCAFLSGKTVGYVAYDCTHYYLHQGTPKPGTFRHAQKVYHNTHHYKDSHEAYGVTSPLWDYVFSTVG